MKIKKSVIIYSIIFILLIMNVKSATYGSCGYSAGLYGTGCSAAQKNFTKTLKVALHISENTTNMNEELGLTNVTYRNSIYWIERILEEDKIPYEKITDNDINNNILFNGSNIGYPLLISLGTTNITSLTGGKIKSYVNASGVVFSSGSFGNPQRFKRQTNYDNYTAVLFHFDFMKNEERHNVSRNRISVNNASFTDAYSGKICGALRLNGTQNNYLQVLDQTEINTNFLNGVNNFYSNLTILVWVYLNVTGTVQQIVDKQYTGFGAYQMFYNSNQIRTTIGNGSTIVNCDSGVNLNPAQWTHIGFTFNEIEQRCYYYQNGTNVTNTSINLLGGVVNSSRNLRVGERLGATFRSFNGSFDDLLISGRFYSQNEVALIYNNTEKNSNQGEFNDILGVNITGCSLIHKTEDISDEPLKDPIYSYNINISRSALSHSISNHYPQNKTHFYRFSELDPASLINATVLVNWTGGLDEETIKYSNDMPYLINISYGNGTFIWWTENRGFWKSRRGGAYEDDFTFVMVNKIIEYAYNKTNTTYVKLGRWKQKKQSAFAGLRFDADNWVGVQEDIENLSLSAQNKGTYLFAFIGINDSRLGKSYANATDFNQTLSNVSRRNGTIIGMHYYQDHSLCCEENITGQWDAFWQKLNLILNNSFGRMNNNTNVTKGSLMSAGWREQKRDVVNNITNQLNLTWFGSGDIGMIPSYNVLAWDYIDKANQNFTYNIISIPTSSYYNRNTSIFEDSMDGLDDGIISNWLNFIYDNKGLINIYNHGNLGSTLGNQIYDFTTNPVNSIWLTSFIELDKYWRQRANITINNITKIGTDIIVNVSNKGNNRIDNISLEVKFGETNIFDVYNNETGILLESSVNDSYMFNLTPLQTLLLRFDFVTPQINTVSSGSLFVGDSSSGSGEPTKHIPQTYITNCSIIFVPSNITIYEFENKKTFTFYSQDQRIIKTYLNSSKILYPYIVYNYPNYTFYYTGLYKVTILRNSKQNKDVDSYLSLVGDVCPNNIIIPVKIFKKNNKMFDYKNLLNNTIKYLNKDIYELKGGSNTSFVVKRWFLLTIINIFVLFILSFINFSLINKIILYITINILTILVLYYK